MTEPVFEPEPTQDATLLLIPLSLAHTQKPAYSRSLRVCAGMAESVFEETEAAERTDASNKVSGIWMLQSVNERTQC